MSHTPSNFSIAGFLFGTGFTFVWFIRYFFIYPDKNIALLGCLVGVCIMAISFIYDRQIKMIKDLIAVEDCARDLEDIMIKNNERRSK